LLARSATCRSAHGAARLLQAPVVGGLERLARLARRQVVLAQLRQQPHLRARGVRALRAPGPCPPLTGHCRMRALSRGMGGLAQGLTLFRTHAPMQGGLTPNKCASGRPFSSLLIARLSRDTTAHG